MPDRNENGGGRSGRTLRGAEQNRMSGSRLKGPAFPVGNRPMPGPGFPERDPPLSFMAAGAKTRGPDVLCRSDQRAPRRRRGATSRILVRVWAVWAVSAFIGVLGVLGTFAVLWVTAPAAPSRAVAVLANSSVSDAATLMMAVQTAALQGTPDVKGAIDEVRRTDDGQVTLKGWVVDAASRGQPLTIMVFAGGRNALTIAPSGARQDVASALGLSGQAAANLSFQGSLSCSRGERLIVVAVTPRNTYGYFGSLVCPE